MDEIVADAYKKVRKSEYLGPSLCLLQYPIFQIPTFDRWIVVVSGKYIEELHRAPDDVMSFVEAAREVGLSHFSFSLTHPIIISVEQKRLHSWRVPRKGSMACQYHSRISRSIRFYVETGPLPFPACPQSA